MEPRSSLGKAGGGTWISLSLLLSSGQSTYQRGTSNRSAVLAEPDLYSATSRCTVRWGHGAAQRPHHCPAAVPSAPWLSLTSRGALSNSVIAVSTLGGTASGLFLRFSWRSLQSNSERRGTVATCIALSKSGGERGFCERRAPARGLGRVERTLRCDARGKSTVSLHH
jgi:hypothetical protein